MDEFETDTRDALLAMTARQHILTAANLHASSQHAKDRTDTIVRETRVQTQLMWAAIKMMDDQVRINANLTPIPVFAVPDARRSSE